jgi:two-component system, response regulator PdtaR
MVEAEANLAFSRRTVLVVDDEVMIRLVVSECLRDSGLRVVEAENADEALSYVKSDPSVGLVFSDVKMPGSMDGIELAAHLKIEFPYIKVVLASGHLLADQSESAILLLLKPYSVGEAAAYITSILDGKDPLNDRSPSP